MQAILCSIDWDKLAKISSTLLTPTIAGIVAYVAVQQWRVNKRQARLALFDKRLAIFHSTMELIAAVVRDANVDVDALFKFSFETREHEFLFGSDMREYMDQLWKKGLELHMHGATREEPAKITELTVWFHKQGTEAAQKFKKYMHFPEP